MGHDGDYNIIIPEDSGNWGDGGYLEVSCNSIVLQKVTEISPNLNIPLDLSACIDKRVLLVVNNTGDENDYLPIQREVECAGNYDVTVESTHSMLAGADTDFSNCKNKELHDGQSLSKN